MAKLRLLDELAGLACIALTLSFSPVLAQTLPSPGIVFQDCEGCPEMVALSPAKFMMGASDEDRKVPGTQYAIPVELPQHQVRIDYSFAIGKFTVTVREFGQFIAETGYKAGGDCMIVVATHGSLKGKFQGQLSSGFKEAWIKLGNAMIANASYRHQGRETTQRHPATCVSRIEAKAYLSWLSQKTGRKYRFPTEAEWEYAIRAGEQLPFFWGSDQGKACEHANFADKDSPFHPAIKAKCAESPPNPFTSAVGSFKPNKWGLYDLAGNTFEFIEDCYVDGYEGAPVDGSPWLRSDVHPDFNRPDGRCVQWGLRGYSYIHKIGEMRSAARCSLEDEDAHSGIVALRVAVSLTDNAWDLRR